MAGAIVGIDVGTTKVCVLVGESRGEGGLRVIGMGVAPSRGLRRGVVVDKDEATKAIAAAVKQAEEMAGFHIGEAYVGIAGDHINSLNSRGSVAISHGSHVIRQEDIDRATEAAKAIAVPHDRRIIHIIPRGFSLDDQDGIRDPLGMHGFKLGAEVHLITGATASIHNLVRCVQDAGVAIKNVVLQPLASGEAVLTPTEGEMGVVLADIGGGTTDIAIFIGGTVWHTAVLGVAGNHLTNDLAVGLHTPLSTAEETKVRYGLVLSSSIPASETVEVLSFGDTPRSSVQRRFISQILEARMAEIFGLIQREIKKSGYDGLLPAGAVLTGGTAELGGISELGKRILNLPVRVGLPRPVEGLVEVTKSPAYATAVGLLHWGIRYGALAQAGKKRRFGLGHFGGLFKPFLPIF